MLLEITVENRFVIDIVVPSERMLANTMFVMERLTNVRANDAIDKNHTFPQG